MVPGAGVVFNEQQQQMFDQQKGMCTSALGTHHAPSVDSVFRGGGGGLVVVVGGDGVDGALIIVYFGGGIRRLGVPGGAAGAGRVLTVCWPWRADHRVLPHGVLTMVC